MATLRLEPMAQLARAAGAQDNWTGVGDPTERRKRQNRLNQRARRHRKSVHQGAKRRECKQNEVGLGYRESHLAATTKPSATASRVQRVYFPMTADHILLNVVASNVARAIFTNVEIVNIFRRSFVSSFSCEGNVATLLEGPELCAKLSIPKALAPTSLQLVVPHRRWIDIFPFPQLRDNLLTATSQGRLDENAFFEDIVGQGFEDCEYPDLESSPVETIDPKMLFEKTQIPDSCRRGEIGLVAWGDPWDVSGWEVTEGFIRKWHFLFRGCQGIIETTNYWRELRGEDRLVIEV